MPPEREAFTYFREKHPRIYSFLYQTILIIITLECAVVIARYGPEHNNLASESTESTTPHICNHGAREDYVDLGPLTVITPYIVLCPSTPFFLISLITFIGGIVKFNVLHKDDIWLRDLLSPFFVACLFPIDWRNILVSVRMLLPITIWSGSVTSALVHLVIRTCFPRAYNRVKKTRRVAEEERKRKILERGRDADVEVKEKKQ